MPRQASGTRRNQSHKIQNKLPDAFKPGFLSALDGRCDLSRTLRANYQAIVDDIGDDCSHIKSSLVERYCWLECVLQTLEVEMAQGKQDKGECLGKWIQGCNALLGLSKTLGIERRSSSQPWASLVKEAESKAKESAK